MPARLPPKTATITRTTVTCRRCRSHARHRSWVDHLWQTRLGRPQPRRRRRVPGEERGQGQDRQDSEQDGAPWGLLALEHLAEHECGDEPEDSERGDDGELLRARQATGSEALLEVPDRGGGVEQEVGHRRQHECADDEKGGRDAPIASRGGLGGGDGGGGLQHGSSFDHPAVHVVTRPSELCAVVSPSRATAASGASRRCRSWGQGETKPVSPARMRA